MAQALKPRLPWITRLSAGVLRFLFSFRYKVKIIGKDYFLSGQPALFLPNHQSLLDPVMIVLTALKYRCFVSPAITEEYLANPLFRFFLKQINANPVSNLEKGKRDVAVLQKLVEHSLAAFEQGKNMLIYPSGKLSDQPQEHIGNKQGVYTLVKELPPKVRVVIVRNTGFWDTRWSKKETGKTPDFLKVFLREGWFVIRHLVIFTPRVLVTMELIDITEEVKNKAHRLSRQDFNRYLEDIFNNK